MSRLTARCYLVIMNPRKSDRSRRARSPVHRRLNTIKPLSATTAEVEGHRVVLFCSNDYLGLSKDPRVIEAAARASMQYGAGSGASRYISGTFPIHTELEARLAHYKGSEAAVLFGSGYLANIGVIPAVVTREDTLLCDRSNHASLWDGCRLSKATVRPYPHGDPDAAERYLDRSNRPGRVIIVTDGVFSMDGDLAPLIRLSQIVSRRGGFLIVDEAHATGVVGPRGRGTFEHHGLPRIEHLEIGTLGKALGAYGAYATGSKEKIDGLIQTSRSLIYSTALPPPAVAAALRALDIIIQEPERRERLWKNRDRLVSGLSSLGLPISRSDSPIIPVRIGSADETVSVTDTLLRHGIYAPAIRPPTVPEGTSRIRLTVSSEHTSEQIERLLGAMAVVIRHHPGTVLPEQRT